jgi:hypothetical protein
MRKHGIDLEDNSLGDGSRTKRLDRKDFDALMGGDGQSGIFTWREKNRRKVRAIIVLVFAKSSHRGRSMQLSVGILGVGTISDSACLLLTTRYSCGTNSYSGHFCNQSEMLRDADSKSQWLLRLFAAKAIHTLVTGGASVSLCLNAYTGVCSRGGVWSSFWLI